MALKVVALGRTYFESAGNLLDCAATCGGLAALAASAGGTSASAAALRALRALRLLRMFTLRSELRRFLRRLWSAMMRTLAFGSLLLVIGGLRLKLKGGLRACAATAPAPSRAAPHASSPGCVPPPPTPPAAVQCLCLPSWAWHCLAASGTRPPTQGRPYSTSTVSDRPSSRCMTASRVRRSSGPALLEAQGLQPCLSAPGLHRTRPPPACSPATGRHARPHTVLRHGSHLWMGSAVLYTINGDGQLRPAQPAGGCAPGGEGEPRVPAVCLCSAGRGRLRAASRAPTLALAHTRLRAGSARRSMLCMSCIGTRRRRSAHRGVATRPRPCCSTLGGAAANGRCTGC